MAILVAALVTAPAWRFRIEAGDAYAGIPFVGVADGEFYLSMVRRAAAGDYASANPYLHEWRQRTGEVTEPVARWIWATGWKLSPFDLHTFSAVFIGLLAAVQFLLFTSIARAVGASERVAIATAGACCLIPNIWAYYGYDFWLLQSGRQLIDFLTLWRPMQPSLTSLGFWAALLAGTRFAARPSWTTGAVVAALAWFSWDLYRPTFPLNGMLLAGCVVAAWAKRERRMALGLAAAGAVVLALRVTALRGGLAVSPEQEEVLAGNLIGLRRTEPILTGNVATLLVLAVVSLLPPVRRHVAGAAHFAIWAPLLAILICWNQQVITGRIYQPFHYDWFWTVPCVWLAIAALSPAMAAGADALGARFRNGRAFRIAVAAAAVVGILAVAAAAFPGVSGGMLRSLGLARSSTLAEPWSKALVGLGVAAAMALAAVALRAGRRGALAQIACVAVVATGTVHAWNTQTLGYSRRASFYVTAQKVAPAFAWIEANTGPDDVIACAREEYGRLVAAHTDRCVYIAGEAQFGGGVPPEEEFRARRIIQWMLLGVSRDDLAGGLGDGGAFHGGIFKWRAFGKLPPRVASVAHSDNPAPLPPGAIDDVLQQFDSLAAAPEAERLSRYRLDYLLWTDDASAAFREPVGHPAFEKVLEGPGFRLWRHRAAR